MFNHLFDVDADVLRLDFYDVAALPMLGRT